VDRKEAHIALRQALAQAMSSKRVALEFTPRRLRDSRSGAIARYNRGLFASRILGGCLGVQSTLRRFERCSRGRDPAHRRAAQKLGGNPVHSEPQEKGRLRL